MPTSNVGEGDQRTDTLLGHRAGEGWSLIGNTGKMNSVQALGGSNVEIHLFMSNRKTKVPQSLFFLLRYMYIP